MTDLERLFQSAKTTFESCAESMCLATDFMMSEGPVQLQDNLAGAYLTLVADQGSLLIGLMSDPSGLEFLAKTMLGMEPDEGVLEISDIVDAMGELTNVWAGMYKTELASELQNIRIGLPMFAHGKIDSPRSSNTQIFKLIVGVIPVYLFVCQSLEADRKRKTPRGGRAA